MFYARYKLYEFRDNGLIYVHLKYIYLYLLSILSTVSQEI